MGRCVVAPSWLSATIRCLEKRVQALEQKPSPLCLDKLVPAPDARLLRVEPFQFNGNAPEFVPPYVPRTTEDQLNAVFSYLCHKDDIPYEFIAPDDAHDAMGCDDNEQASVDDEQYEHRDVFLSDLFFDWDNLPFDHEQDAANNDATRSILSAEVFDNEEVPSPESDVKFLRPAKFMDVEEVLYDYGDSKDKFSDFSQHTFIDDPVSSDDNEQDSASEDVTRSAILSAEIFNKSVCDDDGEQHEYFSVPKIEKVQKSVDVPQVQCIDKTVDVPVKMSRDGDVGNPAIDANTSDFSANQFTAREFSPPAYGFVRLTVIESSEYDSDNDENGDYDGEQYEHRDVETHANDGSSSGLSLHQFIASATPELKFLAERLTLQLHAKTAKDQITSLEALLKNESVLARLAAGADCPYGEVCKLLHKLLADLRGFPDVSADENSSSSSCTSEAMPNIIPAGDPFDNEQYGDDSDSENDWAEAYLEGIGVQVPDEL